MAFKRTLSPTFPAKVTVNIPGEKGGFDKSTFTAIFKRTSADEVAALREAGLSNEDTVRKVLVGWEMKDEDTNEDVPFNKAELEAALQILPMPMATALAFWETVNGARSKNS
jgi:hypothetical protein